MGASLRKLEHCYYTWEFFFWKFECSSLNIVWANIRIHFYNLTLGNCNFFLDANPFFVVQISMRYLGRTLIAKQCNLHVFE